MVKQVAPRQRQRTPSANPAVEPDLAECVSVTGLHDAFIAVPHGSGARASLRIRIRYTRYARDDRDDSENGQRRASNTQGSRLPAVMRQALQSALDSGCVVLATGRRGNRANPHPRVLIAAPLMGGVRARAVLAAAVRSVQRIAARLESSALLAPPTISEGNAFIRAAGARQDVLLHELPVPLSAANLLFDRLTRLVPGTTVTDTTHDSLRATHAAVNKAQSMVRPLSQLNALNQGSLPNTPRPLQVQEIIERAIALLSGSVHRLRRLTPDALPAIIADTLWLTHILTNLLENAMTHTPAPQLVDMTATAAPERQRIVISITSYGAGMLLAETGTHPAPLLATLPRGRSDRQGSGPQHRQVPGDGDARALCAHRIDGILGIASREQCPATYVLFTRSQKAQAEMFNSAPPSDFDIVEQDLLATGKFVLVYHNADADVLMYVRPSQRKMSTRLKTLPVTGRPISRQLSGEFSGGTP